MGELDYQMALLLQHRFEQEHKSLHEVQKLDHELARELQQQFEQEADIDKPTPSLVYKQSKRGLNSSKCLIDPSWELVDPTPDIHNLFIAFNERFFWNKLLAVCVSWSKRMTSCAGVCSYNGRGGMCSITLSEPLLKLRPRKDLVETLLHEMIHAFLFVTHNNRDREGHGPEFHKHMYRINKESGTSITVYHDFHDEVRLYQQHWWRCNGPCQHRKPYFGVVRRATNRAPGPNDRWWAAHSQTCGGTFTKVKEPEKKKKDDNKTTSKIVSKVKSKDIRSFIPTAKINDLSNIKGFKDLNTSVKGKYNSPSTITVTKNSMTTSNNDSSYKPTIFNTNKEIVKTNSGTSGCTDDFISVRNHWENKFSNSKKRPGEEQPSISKSPKVCESTSSKNQCECPVCHKMILMSDLNDHLDLCLISETELKEPETVDLKALAKPEETKECPLCDRRVAISVFDSHVEKCILNVYDGEQERLNEPAEEKVSCLACGNEILKSELNSHLDECMNDFFQADCEGNTAQDAVDMNENDEGDCEESKTSQFNCPFCMQLINENNMKEHLDNCLNVDPDGVIQSLMDDSEELFN